VVGEPDEAEGEGVEGTLGKIDEVVDVGVLVDVGLVRALGAVGEVGNCGLFDTHTDGYPLHLHPSAILQPTQPALALPPTSQVSSPLINPSPHLVTHLPYLLA